MVNDTVPMTREGYEKLQAELAVMQQEMVDVTRRVAEARGEGDLSENAEYHGAREAQGLLQARMNMLKDKLARAYIVDTSSLPKDVVRFGAIVKVQDVDYDDEEEFELVGPGEDDPDKNRILTSSPIGQGLMGKKKGELAEIEVPRGKLKFKILEISYRDA